MIELINNGAYLLRGRLIEENVGLSIEEINNKVIKAGLQPLTVRTIRKEDAQKNTMAHKILTAHNTSDNAEQLKIKFDALASHDITYVGIIQTAIASGLKEFPVPYVLTNCHNSLCAVGGTINEDDHVFGLSAARKFGGDFVPAHLAVIHQYMREMMAGCGKMILGSDSHTRYGVLGTMGIGEGGPEIVKQLLSRTYDIAYPEIIAIYLEGKPRRGVGAQDVALAIIGAVFKTGFVKNKVMEFVGPGIRNLSVDFRNGIDVMTTETTCLSSIWQTDEKVEQYFATHGRQQDYRKVEPGEVSYYDGVVKVDLNRIEPMIALPFHPSNVYPIAELNSNAADILHAVEAEAKKQIENPELSLHLTDKLANGRLQVDQGIIVGCSGGTFENLTIASQIVNGKATGNGNFSLSVYPASQPVFTALLRNGAIEKLTQAGAVIRTAFCGPCFGAGDTPSNNGLSIRHSTRNFPNREGSKPGSGQLASVALMDARSIAATAIREGVLTAATEIEYTEPEIGYSFDKSSYESRVYQGSGLPQKEEELKYGPGIANWPEIRPLPKNLLLKIASVIHDPVTTTDELIPSGETSSYRSNPFALAEFTLSRKDPAYVGKAKAVYALEMKRQKLISTNASLRKLENVYASAFDNTGEEDIQSFIKNTGLGSAIFARRPGDGSAREQAASCQRVLGGDANIAIEYATKRYRSNVVNWGMIPFTIDEADIPKLAVDDSLFIPGIREVIAGGAEKVRAFVIYEGNKIPLELSLRDLSDEERKVILAGCLINYYAGTML